MMPVMAPSPKKPQSRAPKALPPIEHRQFESFDGTQIGYQVIGKGKKTILLCNGLGGTALAYQPIYEKFGKDYRFICWDYRGLFKSAMPKDLERLTMDDHIRDMELLFQKEKISKALLIGWSMGVQICLEFYNQYPQKVAGMVLLNGTYGFPFETALNTPLARYVLPSMNELAHRIMPSIQPRIRPLAKRFLNWEGFVGVLSRVGMVHRDIDRNIIKQVAEAMFASDMQTYHAIMRYLSRHNAWDVLPKIKVPVLIIAGSADRITPLRLSQKMKSRIKGSELLNVEGATHYAILEFPDLINKSIGKFLEKNYRAA